MIRTGWSSKTDHISPTQSIKLKYPAEIMICWKCKSFKIEKYEVFICQESSWSIKWDSNEVFHYIYRSAQIITIIFIIIIIMAFIVITIIFIIIIIIDIFLGFMDACSWPSDSHHWSSHLHFWCKVMIQKYKTVQNYVKDNNDDSHQVCSFAQRRSKSRDVDIKDPATWARRCWGIWVPGFLKCKIQNNPVSGKPCFSSPFNLVQALILVVCPPPDPHFLYF